MPFLIEKSWIVLESNILDHFFHGRKFGDDFLFEQFLHEMKSLSMSGMIGDDDKSVLFVFKRNCMAREVFSYYLRPFMNEIDKVKKLIFFLYEGGYLL